MVKLTANVLSTRHDLDRLKVLKKNAFILGQLKMLVTKVTAFIILTIKDVN
jgi:hypothetical protein